MSTKPVDPAVRDRRTVLRSAAALGLAGAATPLLAACGDDGEAGSGATTPASSAPATSTEPTTSASSSAPATSSAPAGNALGSTSDVPVGGGAVFKDAKVVVTQPTAGQFKGFSAVCTHQQCIVADVAGGTINCGCHGSKFKIEDGSVSAGPASSALPAANITVQGDQILGPAS
jgi:Rieske Fe-S protein